MILQTPESYEKFTGKKISGINQITAGKLYIFVRNFINYGQQSNVGVYMCLSVGYPSTENRDFMKVAKFLHNKNLYYFDQNHLNAFKIYEFEHEVEEN